MPSMNIRNIPAELLLRLKTIALHSGKSLRELVIELLEKFAKESEKNAMKTQIGSIAPNKNRFAAETGTLAASHCPVNGPPHDGALITEKGVKH